MRNTFLVLTSILSFTCLSPTLRAAEADKAKDAEAKAQAIIDKAAEFLKSKQNPDGGWQTQREPSAFTAIALRALVRSGKYTAKDEFIRKGYDKLIAQQSAAGVYKDLLANYNTAIAVMSLAAADDPQYKAAIDKAVAYLKNLQWNESIEGGPKGEAKITPDNPWYGGMGYGREGRPDGSNTAFSVEALNAAGVKPDDKVMKDALKFVTRMQNLSETNDQKWAGDDGGSIYTPANNGESKAGEYTVNGKRMLRSYGSMTYAMLKSYIYAGLTKDDPRVKAAWDWISKNWTVEENPGLRASDPSMAQFGLYYYYLTLARALHAYGQPNIIDPQGNKHDWRVEFIDKMASLQKPDGSFAGDKKWMEDSPILATSFALVAMEDAARDLAGKKD